MKDTRTKLLKISARMFARKGYSGTSVRDIVRAAHANISAITYHFGGKRELFFETIHFLIEQHRRQVWGKNFQRPTPAQIKTYSYAQALGLLHQILDNLLDNNFRRKNIYLEHIFTQVELESSEMRTMLLDYMAPFQELPLALLIRLTGLPEKSTELLCVAHSIFGQILLSESRRLAFENQLGKGKNYSPELRQKIKQRVWAHILAILNLYKKELNP